MSTTNRRGNCCIPLFFALAKKLHSSNRRHELRVNLIKHYIERVLFSDFEGPQRKDNDDWLVALSGAVHDECVRSTKRGRTLQVGISFVQKLQKAKPDQKWDRLFNGEYFLPDSNNQLFSFRHEIFQNVLLGHRLAATVRDKMLASKKAKGKGLPDLSEAFALATKNKQALDSIVYAAEWLFMMPLLSEAVRVISDFIECVYDWDYESAIEIVMEILRHSKEQGSIIPEVTILSLQAISAEKMFDPFETTSDRARRRVERFDSITKLGLGSCNTIGEVVGRVSSESQRIRTDQAYRDWERVFRRDEASGPTDDHGLGPLREKHSFLGWTAANAQKRGKVSCKRVSHLCGALAVETDKTVRWRITHVLGKSVMFFPQHLFSKL